jgi:3D-(3,5/4)-trihydroxycyclohexane-1,2-dione acylhydrolase (decyclizing)
MKKQSRTSVVVVEIDYQDRVPNYECWWDVPIAEIFEMGTVQPAPRSYVEARKTEGYFWPAKSEE